jgi:hypothetical protein
MIRNLKRQSWSRRPTQSLAKVSDQKLRPIPVSGWHPSLKEVAR